MQILNSHGFGMPHPRLPMKRVLQGSWPTEEKLLGSCSFRCWLYCTKARATWCVNTWIVGAWTATQGAAL